MCTCKGGMVWTDPLRREEEGPWSSARRCTLPRDGEEVGQSGGLHMSSCPSNQAAQRNGGKYPPMGFHLQRIFRPNSIKEGGQQCYSHFPLLPGSQRLKFLGQQALATWSRYWCPSPSAAQACLARNTAGTRPVGQKGRQPGPVGPGSHVARQ